MQIKNIDDLNFSMEHLSKSVDDIQEKISKKRHYPFWLIIVITALTSGFLGVLASKAIEVYQDSNNNHAKMEQNFLNVQAEVIKDSDKSVEKKLLMLQKLKSVPSLEGEIDRVEREVTNDFRMGTKGIVGKILDTNNSPISGARIGLKDSGIFVHTSPLGDFFLPIPKEYWGEMLIIVSSPDFEEKTILLSPPLSRNMVDLKISLKK